MAFWREYYRKNPYKHEVCFLTTLVTSNIPVSPLHGRHVVNSHSTNQKLYRHDLNKFRKSVTLHRFTTSQQAPLLSLLHLMFSYFSHVVINVVGN